MNKTLAAALLAGLLGTGISAVQAETRALVETSMGNIELSLDEQKAPKTVANFVQYANKGFYNHTIFHRVIDGFMIQGGGMTADMLEKPTAAPIANEAANGLKNTAGTVAMARTANPDSATSQFFINLVDNTALDHRGESPAEYGYAVFGKVSKGMDVVQRIGKVRTTGKLFHQNVPAQPVVIKKITILK